MGYRVKAGSKWDDGKIPFMFDEASVDKDLQNLIIACMASWERYVNEDGGFYINFMECDPKELPSKYVLIKSTTDQHASTSSGELGKPEKTFCTFTINTYRKDFNSIPHELGHTLGLVHEQQRSRAADEAAADSAANARLYYTGNDKEAKWKDWDKAYEAYGAYDLQSIMHYPGLPRGWQWNYAPWQAATESYYKAQDQYDGLKALAKRKAKPPSNAVGQELNYPTVDQVRNQLWRPSPGDIATVREFYRPPPRAPLPQPVLAPAPASVPAPPLPQKAS